MDIREKLIELIKHIVIPHFAIQIADHLITNDVVPVVRCKDCVRYDRKDEFCGGLECSMGENDYCSYGKRREENAVD